MQPLNTVRDVVAFVGAAFAVSLALATGMCASSRAATLLQPSSYPKGFVDLAAVAPDIVVDLRYAGSDNFVGRRIDGYEAPRCILTQRAAQALAAVQRDMSEHGLGLKVFDCYRPERAVAHFLRWAREGADTAMKARHYPQLDKRELFRRGYIARRSGHSRGSTVDLTLVRTSASGAHELDMGTSFDFFSTAAGSGAVGLTAQQRFNRHRLAEAMKRRGFRGYAKEWWHFTLAQEPFPHTYFDFVVQ
ncbi:MAG TPA: M15 family metallopeptidase [Pseudolabrys sp.]|nr:M15 family metallopeptidase [Pseudolabrys sp.]